MWNEALTVVTIFFLVPAIIGFFAYRDYKQAVAREKEELAEKQEQNNEHN